MNAAEWGGCHPVVVELSSQLPDSTEPVERCWEVAHPNMNVVELHGTETGASRWVSLLFQSDYHFSSSVALFQIPDRLWDLAQLVTAGDDRFYFSGLDEVGKDV
jgi:hypothetical protein